MEFAFLNIDLKSEVYQSLKDFLYIDLIIQKIIGIDNNIVDVNGVKLVQVFE
jgi:hypothetical protein